MPEGFLSLPDDWRTQLHAAFTDDEMTTYLAVLALVESWQGSASRPCKHVISTFAGLPGSECIAFAVEGSDYCKPHRDALKAMELQHKTEGGMCCNGKRGCGGPGSYCCSQTVYFHPHDDGTTGPFNTQENPR